MSKAELFLVDSGTSRWLLRNNRSVQIAALLAAQRLRRFRFVHLLIAPLVAMVLTGVLIWQGYLVSLTGQFTGRLDYPTLPADILARVMPGVTPPVVTDARLQLQLNCWDVVAPGGQVEMAGVTSSQLATWQEPAAGEVLLPESKHGQVFLQEVGDQITLARFSDQAWRRVQARVAGYYSDGGYLSPILVNAAWALEWVGANPESVMLGYPEQANKQLDRWSGLNPQAELTTSVTISQDASGLVGSLYSGGNAAVFLGCVFLALGFGILAMLVFLDSRTELAVLKAMGLRPREVGLLFWAEFGVSTLAGILLARLVMLWVGAQFADLLTLNGTVYRTGVLVVAGSFAFAMLAPARLAVRAQVNELLLRRPILLWSRTVSATERKNPGLDDLHDRGCTCIQLERDEHGFPGVVLHRQGASVMQGETLAWQSVWLGMGEKKYVAPHAGVLEVVDAQRGVLAISPCPSLPLAPRPGRESLPVS